MDVQYFDLNLMDVSLMRLLLVVVGSRRHYTPSISEFNLIIDVDVLLERGRVATWNRVLLLLLLLRLQHDVDVERKRVWYVTKFWLSFWPLEFGWLVYRRHTAPAAPVPAPASRGKRTERWVDSFTGRFFDYFLLTLRSLLLDMAATRHQPLWPFDDILIRKPSRSRPQHQQHQQLI